MNREGSKSHQAGFWLIIFLLTTKKRIMSSNFIVAIIPCRHKNRILIQDANKLNNRCSIFFWFGKQHSNAMLQFRFHGRARAVFTLIFTMDMLKSIYKICHCIGPIFILHCNSLQGHYRVELLTRSSLQSLQGIGMQSTTFVCFGYLISLF